MKIKEINCETGEEIIRDATSQEINQAEIDAISAEAEATAKAQAEAQAEAKRSAALAKLEALGLDEDDLKALGL